jgi:hypothetical protein
MLLTWRLIDLADEFLKGEIHMSTSAGILTGMAAFLLQALIIVGLALVIFWIKMKTSNSNRHCVARIAQSFSREATSNQSRIKYS